MAVKASATITIWNLVDINSTTWYYKLQSSTASAPSKPTANTPTGWTTTEPTYTEGSTNTLYTTCKTTYSDDTFEYSDVSKSSSYEAAKTAYNKALAANNTANDAKDTVDNMEIGGRNLLTGTFGDWGLVYTPTTGEDRGQHIADFVLPDDAKVGDEFAFSFDIKLENFNSQTGYTWKTSLQGKVDDMWLPTAKNILINSIPYPKRIWTSNGTYHCVGIAKVVNDVNKKFEIKLRTDYSDGNGSIYIKNLKIEKGNKATDWTPAPEDIDDKFLEMNSTIELEKNSILASVSSTYATNTALGNEVENIEAMLELKINSADLVSELNASADVITFNSNRLVINSDNFKLTSSGDITATSGTIGGFTVTADKLYNSTGGANNYVGLGKKDAAWAFWAGALDENSSATAPFRVGHDGTAYATKLTATGATLTNCTFIGSNDAIELSIKESDGWQIKLSDYETAVIMNANGFAVRSKSNYLYGGIDDLGLYGENGKRPSYSGHTHWAISVDDTKCGISGDGSNFRAYNDAGALKDNKVTCGSTSSRWTRVY
ncbi:MAG: hypothetical protein PHT76_13585, partial [Anaerostipes sp.]|nr:hypothetical protein [Anaerostipes sp.]